MKRNRRILSLMFVLISVFALSMNASAAAKINKTKAVLVKGTSVQLKVTGTTGKPKWKSGNKAIATVSSNGLVKAKKKGNTVISAALAGKTLKCRITVEDPKINKTSVTVEAGSKLQLKVKGSSQKVKWSSRDKSIATVSSKGVVKGVKAGKTKVVAFVGEKKFTCKIIVKEKKQDAGSGQSGSGSSGSAGSARETSENDGPASGMVWIPRSGSKYHSTSTCSGMRNPSYVPLSQALAAGYTACSKCW